MPSHGPGFLESLEVKAEDGWRDLLAGGCGPYLYVVDGNGVRYDTLPPGLPSKISVEEYGPVRAGVKIEGFHTGSDGHRFCPYVLQFHLFSGSKQLQVHHTFVFDQDPDQFVLAGLGMEWPLKLGGSLRAAVGGDEAPHWADHWKLMSFRQCSDRRYEVNRDGELFGSGGRAPGWASESGDRGSAAVALRDGWREYPKGIALRPGVVDIGLWPLDYENPLDLVNPWKEKVIRPKTEEELLEKLRAHPTAGVGMKGFLGKADLPPDAGEGNMQSAKEALELEDRYLGNRLVAYGDTGTDNAMGLATSGQWPVGIATAGDRGGELVVTDDIGFGAGGLEALIMYDVWRVTGDQRIVEALRRVAEWILLNDTPLFGTMPNKGVFVAYAYRMTGDRKFRQAIEQNLNAKIDLAEHRTGLAHAWGEKTRYVDHFIDTHPEVELDFLLWTNGYTSIIGGSGKTSVEYSIVSDLTSLMWMSSKPPVNCSTFAWSCDSSKEAWFAVTI